MSTRNSHPHRLPEFNYAYIPILLAAFTTNIIQFYILQWEGEFPSLKIRLNNDCQELTTLYPTTCQPGCSLYCSDLCQKTLTQYRAANLCVNINECLEKSGCLESKTCSKEGILFKLVFIFCYCGVRLWQDLCVRTIWRKLGQSLHFYFGVFLYKDNMTFPKF